MIQMVLGLLAPLVKPLVAWVQERGMPLLRDLMIYRKGAADQRRKDRIAQIESQLDTIRRAQDAAQEIEHEAQVDRYSGKPSRYIRVRKPGGWDPPK